MSGLREKKKIISLKRIEDSALKMFDSIGFEAATMEKIAREAELGVGTLYNYYPSKADILMGIIAKRAVPYGEELQRISVQKNAAFPEALGKCLDIYLDSFSFFSRRIWKEFTVTSLSKGLPLFSMVRSVDTVFIQALSTLVLNWKDKGIVRREAQVGTATETLYSILFYHIMAFISGNDLDADDIRRIILEQWKTVIDGLI